MWYPWTGVVFPPQVLSHLLALSETVIMAPHPSADTRGSAPSTTTALLFALVLGLLLYAL